MYCKSCKECFLSVTQVDKGTSELLISWTHCFILLSIAVCLTREAACVLVIRISVSSKCQMWPSHFACRSLKSRQRRRSRNRCSRVPEAAASFRSLFFLPLSLFFGQIIWLNIESGFLRNLCYSVILCTLLIENNTPFDNISMYPGGVLLINFPGG